MKYCAEGSTKYGRGRFERSAPVDNLCDALGAAHDMVRTKRFKTVVVLRDSEGYDHPSNAGKWFLDRIVK